MLEDSQNLKQLHMTEFPCVCVCVCVCLKFSLVDLPQGWNTAMKYHGDGGNGLCG